MVYSENTYGVYIQDIYGNLYSENKWDGTQTPNGIAVIAEECSFVMALKNAHSATGLIVSPLSGMVKTEELSEAISDYAGEYNTTRMYGRGNNGTGGADYAADFLFPNGVYGYLGAAGEWNVAQNNKSKIVSALNICGGTNMSSGTWTSTAYNETNWWYVKWGTNGFSNRDRYDSALIRAFSPYMAKKDYIEFSVEGIFNQKFKCVKGTMWSDFINSSLNNGIFGLEGGSGVIFSINGINGTIYLSREGNTIEYGDKIISNHTYYAE